MDLKSGCLYWPAISPSSPRFDPLDQDIQCDLAIIGAGITGALVAFHFAEAGVDAVVVDRRDPAHGSTAASTGLLQYEIDTTLSELIDRIGRKNATQAYRLSVQTIDDFERLVAKIDNCDFAIRPSLYLGSEPADAEELAGEFRERRAIGIDVNLLGRDELRRTFGIDRPVALHSSRAAEVDPYKLTLALHRAAIARGGTRVFGQTEIRRYDADSSGVTLSTSTGAGIRARKVIFATGYETPEVVDRRLCTLKSTYALVSQPLGKSSLWHEQCLIWEHRHPYLYARSTHDGRAMVGGADIDSADPNQRDRVIGRKARELVDGFHGLLPHLKIEPSCCWAGTFAETKDGLPYIGSLADFPNGYFALGYGGNGITFSLLAARIIRDLFLGRDCPDAELFRFGR
ncbi:MAG TPA: FAD-binding oxidoreductase [Tepidisphaeraceae bacterium]|jgi:glycine/D-amino acid oxidase-like deaminating enzyme